MIVLDASVLIAHLDSTDAHHERATRLLLDAGEAEFGASPLTLAEVLVGPARAGKLAVAASALRRLEIAAVPLPDDAPRRLAMLRSNVGLRLPDCCVLFAAETANAELATFDDRLIGAAQRSGIDVRS